MEFRPLAALVQVELAKLAQVRGEAEEHLNRLRAAHQIFTEIGANGHAERVAGELALQS